MNKVFLNHLSFVITSQFKTIIQAKKATTETEKQKSKY